MDDIVVVDTSIVDNLVPVPGWNQHQADVQQQFEALADARAEFILPVAAIIETGNHIAGLTDGGQRRATAIKCLHWVRRALTPEMPFALSPELTRDEVLSIVEAWPDEAARGLSVTDLSIVRLWELLGRLNQSRRVVIWSTDTHLAGYDRAPRL